MSRQKFKEYAIGDRSITVDLKRIVSVQGVYPNREANEDGDLRKFWSVEIITTVKKIAIEHDGLHELEQFHKELKNDLINGI